MTKSPYWRGYNDGFKYQPTLVFEGGILSIKGKGYGDKDGSGHLSFKDDELAWANDSEDAGYRVLHLPRSELEAIRDHINECLGPYEDDANPKAED